MRKKVLIIGYYFPPRIDVASLRIKGLAKYLPQFGWDPIILTAKLPSKPDSQFRVIEVPEDLSFRQYIKKKLGFSADNSFSEIKNNLAKSNTKWKALFINLIIMAKRIIYYPESKKSWMKYALPICESLFEREHVDAIISSFSPIATHLIAHRLKQKYGVPWIADFRDLWSQNHYLRYGLFGKVIQRNLEVKTLSNADALVTVSRPLADKLSKLHKGKTVYAITNGFDPEEVGTATLTKEFTITYTGHLYEGKRDPSLLFQAVNMLIKSGFIDPETIKIRFFTRIEPWLEKKIEKYNLQDIVTVNRMIPRQEALYHQRSSQILLLLNWNDPRERGVYTGKIFEYLATQRPILAIGGPGGVVAELLNQTQAGIHTSDLDTLITILKKWYQEWKEKGQVSYHGIPEEINKYSHREMARKFAEVLESVTNNRSNLRVK